MTSFYVLRRLNKRQKSDIDQVDQVLVVDAADRQRDHREPSDDQRVALITDIDQVLVVDDADRSREKMESASGKPPPQKKQKPASGGRRLRNDEVNEAANGTLFPSIYPRIAVHLLQPAIRCRESPASRTLTFE